MVESDEVPRPQTKREFGAAAHLANMSVRRAQALAFVDLSQGRGLEIGPLDAGIADPAAHAVSYVDVFDAEGIRVHYAQDDNVLLELIPEIHYPLYEGDSYRPLAEAAAPGAPFDWVIASHVIEHVPDVIGWLNEIASLTAPEAALLLAVPDRRYCFDRHRPPTTVGQAIEAHELGFTRPSIRAIYDFFSAAVTVDTASLWRGGTPPSFERRMFDAQQVDQQVARGRAGDYIDTHVWTWTPQAFVEQIREFRALGLADWYVEKIDQSPDTFEFWVLLRRCGTDGLAGANEVHSAIELPGWLVDEWAVVPAEFTPSSDVPDGSEALAEVERLTRRVAALELKLKRLRESRAMRVGNAALAAPRAVRRWVRR